MGLCRPGALPWLFCVGAQSPAPGLMTCPRAVSLFTDIMPHLCSVPAPQPLSPLSPGNGAETVHKWPEATDEGKRALDHMPREAGLQGRGGLEVESDGPVPRQATLWGPSDPTRWDPRPRAVPSAHFLPLCVKCHHLSSHAAQSMGNSGAECQLCHQLPVTLGLSAQFPSCTTESGGRSWMIPGTHEGGDRSSSSHYPTHRGPGPCRERSGLWGRARGGRGCEWRGPY